MNAQLGVAAPATGSAESEALRRYRSFLCSALVRGESAPPALDGLRLNERRVMALIEAWTVAASSLIPAPERGLGKNAENDLSKTLAPFRDQFRTSVRQTSGSRKQRGRPRAARRAVVAAIDRVGDAFLAIDTDSGEIADANPAAGALLGVDRDALLGVDSLRFVPAAARDRWWTELDAMTEEDATRGFAAELCDVAGNGVAVQATVTRFTSRGRVLALLMMRPRPTATPVAATATTAVAATATIAAPTRPDPGPFVY